jgi:hypothetical protein
MGVALPLIRVTRDRAAVVAGPLFPESDSWEVGIVKFDLLIVGQIWRVKIQIERWELV